LKPGPKPKPTLLKILAGNPSKRPLPTNEPQPEPGAPRAPKRYQKEARQYWHAMTKQLTGCGILTKVDGVALELLVDALTEYRQAVVEVAKTGPIWLEAGEGRIPKFAYSPYWCMMNRAAKRLHAMLREFGMTPSARSSIKAAVPLVDLENDPAVRYFS
jgi:P27 family predicted phage terminase small subunit